MWQQHFFSTPQHAEHVSGTLIKMAQNLWINAKTEEMPPFLARAIQLAKMHGFDNLHKRASMMLANALFMLGRVQESSRCLETLESSGIDAHDVYFYTIYCKLQGNIFAVHGAKAKAYEHFDRAVDAVKRSQDMPQSSGIITDYASRALGLGDIERAKLLREEALLIARRNHSGWFIPYYCLRYADILTRMGHHEIAREYVLEALSSDASAPLLEMTVSAVGIPLALQLGDESLLVRCTRPAAVELALRSKELARVGTISAAFAQLYAVQGNHHKTRFLLDRALEIVTYVDEALDLPLAVARFGTQRQFVRARALLEQRCDYPSSDVAQACIALFDAFASKRKHQITTMQRHAMEAVERFEILQWHGYADLARTLAPHLALRTREPLVPSIAGQLTTREEQVVALVLKGRKNREIALELKIREHTVEKHMSSIMMRLGVRSRHQLAEAHTDSP
jgi:DNA-binding CsgD family transcriptional regulator